MTYRWNDDPPVVLSTQSYNALGQLTSKTLHGEGAEAQQTVDYRYNICGWLTHINDLIYTYQGNRLRAMQDVGQAELGFADEYAYDRAGNLTEDKNKGISKITYDPVLNLPLRINFTDGRRIVYTYDAAGTKLRPPQWKSRCAVRWPFITPPMQMPVSLILSR